MNITFRTADDYGNGLFHEERLDAVLAVVRTSDAETVLDLGCGTGLLLVQLARDPRFRKIVGLDSSGDAIRAAGIRLRESGISAQAPVSLIHGTFTEPDERLAGFDAAAMVETIEHVEPDRLSGVEKAVFACYRPKTVVMTTPNREYNGILGVPRHRLRHPDHRFEWSREKFRSWAGGVAARNGYRVSFGDLGGAHPSLGGPTQMAVFSLCGGPDRALRPVTGT